MAGNSQRRGATRKTPKKGAGTGSGGQRRRSLEGKGPTPKAEDRVYHPAYQRKKTAEARRTTRRDERGRPGRASVEENEVIAGRNAVLEALRARVPAEAVFVAAHLDSDDRTRQILTLADAHGIDAREASRQQLDTMTQGAVHQGVALRVPPYEYGDVDDLLDAAARADQRPLIVALDGITDPRNLGAALRSAGAFGAHGVLIPERRSAGVSVSAWKASAGAAARVPVARATNLVRALGDLKKAGCFVVGLAADGETQIADLPFAADPLVLVVGSEGKGLSRLVHETCDAVASIPIAATTESLNASVAASIALYEVAKARA